MRIRSRGATSHDKWRVASTPRAEAIDRSGREMGLVDVCGHPQGVGRDGQTGVKPALDGKNGVLC